MLGKSMRCPANDQTVYWDTEPNGCRFHNLWYFMILPHSWPREASVRDDPPTTGMTGRFEVVILSLAEWRNLCLGSKDMLVDTGWSTEKQFPLGWNSRPHVILITIVFLWLLVLRRSNSLWPSQSFNKQLAYQHQPSQFHLLHGKLVTKCYKHLLIYSASVKPMGWWLSSWAPRRSNAPSFPRPLESNLTVSRWERLESCSKLEETGTSMSRVVIDGQFAFGMASEAWSQWRIHSTSQNKGQFSSKDRLWCT